MGFFIIGNEARITGIYDLYRNYIETIKQKLPANTYEFAAADWHYNYKDPRCPHDSWVETFIIKEIKGNPDKSKRHIEIVLTLLGAYHDGHIEITYNKVYNYSLEHPGKIYNQKRSLIIGHGDWMLDEISLSHDGHVVHEILFEDNSKWEIECDDIIYKWLPFEVTEQ